MLDDVSWTEWFKELNISPVALTYEALAMGPSSALEYVLNELGSDPSVVAHCAPITLRLSTDESVEWAHRYRSTL